MGPVLPGVTVLVDGRERDTAMLDLEIRLEFLH